MRALLLRCLIALGLVAGLGAAFAVGRSSADDPVDPLDPWRGPGASPVAAPTVDDCDTLLDSYVQRGLRLVGPYGWGGGGDVMMPMEDGALAESSGSADSSAAAPSTVRATSEDTGTNVQEAGVDEPDVVKTDGQHLYRVDGGDDLETYDVSGAAVVRLGSVDLPGGGDGVELLLSGDTLVAIGSSYDATEVTALDVSDPAAPRVTSTATYDSRLVTARLHDGVVRLVLQAGLPELDFTEDEDDNQDLVRATSIEDWLPSVSYDGAEEQPLLDCTEVAVPDDETPLGTLAVVGFDAFAPEAASTTAIATDTDLVYASGEQLYLATTPYAAWPIECDKCGDGPDLFRLPTWLGGEPDSDPAPTVPGDPATRLYAFDLDGRETTYAADGTVDGLVRDRWSMDAHDGVLRLAVGQGTDNAVVTFTQQGGDLVESGRLDDLGVDEDIQSVRWFDDLAIVVTFRQVDPLYAVDLTDPDAPRLMGELEIPGFSAYLHPLGERRLLGLGEGPSDGGGWGAQAGLFDVTDLTAPDQIDVVSFGSGSQALATLDPRQLTWLPDSRRVLTVVSDGSSAYVAELTVGDGSLTERRVQVSGDPYAVRLVPVDGGRVVVVSSQEATFLS